MNKLTSRALGIITTTLALCCMVGCQSTAPKAAKNTSAAPTDLQAYASKQQDYEQLLQEWQTLKPGLSRLLAIEGELNLLLGQLETLSASLAQSQNNANIASAPAKPSMPVVNTTPVAAPVVRYMPPVVTEKVADTIAETVAEKNSELAIEPAVSSANIARADANFALQVASITEPHRLPQMWQKMIDKNPQLLANMEPNFQKTQVKNTDYYRLKVGSFNTQQEANHKCSNLKAAGFPCLVVDYTGSNFAQLTN
jgi:cell division protein FtsN